MIDSIFEDTDENTVSETEAKATVDKSKTGNLLSYLSDLEKDVNGKKAV